MFVNTFAAVLQLVRVISRSPNLTMLLLLLLLQAYTADSQSQKNFTMRYVESCPDVGYFVQRELAPNSLGLGPCFLCFCQNDGTATCWRREDWRCDVEKYHHHHVGRRDTRIRRGISLGDVFFRDATRDVFNKNLPEQCKPFESSFSDGCPPEDWCIGCTVCDCDANGHWDCHVLSFCDKTTRKPSKKRKGNYKRTVIRKAQVKPNNTSKTITVKPIAKPPPKIIRKVIKKPAIINTRTKRQPQTHKNISKKQSKNINRNKPNKVIRRKVPQKKIIKKDVARKPIKLNNRPDQIVLPSTPKFAQAVVQKVLETVKQLMRNDVKKGNSSKILNAVDKKQSNAQKQDRKALMKRFSSIIKQNAKQIKVNRDNIKNKNPARNKREVDDSELLKVISVVPIIKENITVSDKIIPIKEIETSTENPKNHHVTSNVQNETTTILTPTTSVTTEPTFFDEVADDQTSIKTESTTNIPSLMTHMPKPENNVTPYKATSEKWRQIINITKYVPDFKIATENIIHLLNNMTNANDLKFKKWYQIKLLKDREKYFKIGQFKEKEINMFNNHNKSRNNTFVHLKPNVYSQDIKRKIDMPKRNKIRKIIISPRIMKENVNTTYLNKKVSTLQSIFKNILKEFNKNTTKTKSGSKKNYMVKYMRNLFNNLLRRGKSNTTRTKTEILLEKQHTIDMLCENIGSCNLNPRDRRLLDEKVTQLGIETDKVLKIIKIIKGLLHLVDIPIDNQIKNTINKPKSNLKDDVNKLNIILRDSYINDLKSKSLSQTQATQIDYIKKNTQEFIHSVANFGKKLNEIISILKKNNKNVKKRKINEMQEHKFSNYEAFQNLRNLLIRYDIMQNSFFKKIYDSLTIFELKLKKDNQKRLSVDKESKNMANIDNFSRNIVRNLRKLPQLTQNKKFRTKRDVMRDNDAVEYLLMLMEYLLKQNYSLEAAPANDGIDMLIEAIKNAPDIKPIKKKVLEYTPAIFPTRIVPAKIKRVKGNNARKTTTMKNQVVTSRLDNPKFVEPVEEDKDYDDKFLYTRRAVDSDGEGMENNVNIAKSKTDSIPEYLKESDSEPLNDKMDKLEAIDNSESKLVKLNTKESVEEKKYDIFKADLGDLIVFVSSTAPPTHPTVQLTATATITAATTTETSKEVVDKKIEWIDASYEKDNKEEKKVEFTKPPVVVTRTKKATSKEENISTMTREIKTEVRKKTTSAEEVAFKKQMDLLNSLDYVTEKTEFDIESKDLEDPFPSYFG